MVPMWRLLVINGREKVRADAGFGVACRGVIAELIIRKDIGIASRPCARSNRLPRVYELVRGF